MASIRFKNNLVNTYKIVANEKNVLKDYIVEVIYAHDVSVSKCNYQSIGNNHKFDVYLNNSLILKSNLNNDNEGSAPSLTSDGIGSSVYDRYSAVKLEESHSEAIVKTNRYGFSLKITPSPDNFYSSLTGVWTRIRNPQGDIIYNECVPLNTEIDILPFIAQGTSVSEADCADTAKLDFVASNLVVGKNYRISYQVLDSQFLKSSGSITFGENTFTGNSNTTFDYDHQNGSEISGSITVNLDAIQSSLVKISLNDLGIGNDPQLLSTNVCQIICPMCSAAQHNLYYGVDNANTEFNVKLLNLDTVGEVTSLNNVDNDNQNIVVKIKDTDDSNYIDLEFSNLTINNEYQYDIFISPTVTAAELEFEPNSFKFFAGDEREVVSAKINLANNPIVLLYVTLKDLTSDITKQTQPIYIVNTDNFNLATINDNVEFVENTKSVISKSCS